MSNDKIELFDPQNKEDWRNWLAENHQTKQSVWVVFYTQKSGKKNMSWSESVDEALCFGWIDSKKIKIDAETSHQFFSKRKPKGTWSKINKEKIVQLIETGKMMPAGLEVIERAKENGSWTILDEVEELLVPNDLALALHQHETAKLYFESLSKSVRKMLLYWLVSAKRPETRQKRLTEIVERALEGKKPLHLS